MSEMAKIIGSALRLCKGREVRMALAACVAALAWGSPAVAQHGPEYYAARMRNCPEQRGGTEEQCRRHCSVYGGPALEEEPEPEDSSSSSGNYDSGSSSSRPWGDFRLRFRRSRRVGL